MYDKEADELINLVFDAPMNSATRQKLVADWLREFVAATGYGCTGLTTDPSGPQLTGLPEAHKKSQEAYRQWEEARGAVPRGDGPRAEEVIRRLRDDWDME